jgi:nitrate/nitrite transport system ATP-binding protein
VENTMPRSRTRHDIHHDPQYYRIRNHLVDFLVNRSKLFQGGGGGERLKQPPVVRPGLEGERAPVVALPTDKSTPQLKQVINH